VKISKPSLGTNRDLKVIFRRVLNRIMHKCAQKLSPKARKRVVIFPRTRENVCKLPFEESLSKANMAVQIPIIPKLKPNDSFNKEVL